MVLAETPVRVRVRSARAHAGDAEEGTVTALRVRLEPEREPCCRRPASPARAAAEHLGT